MTKPLPMTAAAALATLEAARAEVYASPRYTAARRDADLAVNRLLAAYGHPARY